MKTFSERLKFLMEERKINQQQLAEQNNIHPSTIARYTKGVSKRPYIPHVRVLAKFFHVEFDWLYYGVGERTDSQYSEFIRQLKMCESALDRYRNLVKDQEEFIPQLKKENKSVKDVLDKAISTKKRMVPK